MLRPQGRQSCIKHIAASGSDALRDVLFADFEIDGSEQTVGAGYITQSYDDPLYGELSGFSGRARLEYFLTQLVTLGFTANRSVTDSGIIGSAGILTSRYEATADYEFRRNVIVEGRSSPKSLYSDALVTFEDDRGAYDQKDAEGFIRLNALRLRTLASRKRKG